MLLLIKNTKPPHLSEQRAPRATEQLWSVRNESFVNKTLLQVLEGQANCANREWTFVSALGQVELTPWKLAGAKDWKATCAPTTYPSDIPNSLKACDGLEWPLPFAYARNGTFVPMMLACPKVKPACGDTSVMKRRT